LRAEGHWVFAGGPHVAQHGHRHRQPGYGGGVHRWAVPRVEGVPLVNRGSGLTGRSSPVRQPGADPPSLLLAQLWTPVGRNHSEM
jgi:hypothetical protein